MNRPEVDVLLWAFVGDYGVKSPLVLVDIYSLREIGEHLRREILTIFSHSYNPITSYQFSS